jgi:genome maintenance exonuclease 1
MNYRYKYFTGITYPELESNTAENGWRVYETPLGSAPSVTTILSCLPHPGLDKWRKRVGEEEANRVSKEATDIGSAMHDMLESFVRGEPIIPPSTPEGEMADDMFRVVKTIGLLQLQEVWGIEVALHCHDLYAGRTDLIGKYDGKLSIIDYKTSKRYKKDEWLEDYKCQLSAYAIAHETMFPEYEIEQAVILIGTRPNPKYRVLPNIQKCVIDKEELFEYKVKWMDIVQDFYAGKYQR